MTLRDEWKKGLACDSAGKQTSILGRVVCLSVHPGKIMLFPFLHWFEKRYKHRYTFARLVYAMDLVLVGVMLTLAASAIFLTLYSPSHFEDNIFFSATVAPKDIVSGAPSTLVIRYTNGTDQELRNIRLAFRYPDDFLLQEIEHDGEMIETDEISLERLTIGESGSVRIRGVMFGDVGGEQTFTSEMDFIYGDEADTAGRKLDTFTFSPIASTLELSLELPEKLVASQEMGGTIRYHNTGEIDFPSVRIEPAWPEGFTFISTDTNFSANVFELPAILAGESGEITFQGYLDDVGEEVTFVFIPYFTFAQAQYKQETLTHTAPVIPPQLRLNQSVDKNTLVPGSNAEVSIHYENTGESVVSGVKLGFETDSPFFSKDQYVVDASNYPELQSVEPGQTGTVVITAPLRSWIVQTETDVFENLQVSISTVAEYTLGDGSGQRVISKGSEISTVITTPVVFESFARYTAASGDQLGRGPLPPHVGSETKYWIFWHVSNTTNTIENLHIEGVLPEHVEFTGRQTVSTNSAIQYDEATRTVFWESSSISPTLSPSSKTVGVAFEVALTPTDDQMGTEPTLLTNIFLSGIDETTGVVLNRHMQDMTTNIPTDIAADGKSVVE